MKKSFLLLFFGLLLSFLSHGFAQTNPVADTIIYEDLDESAQFPGGKAKMVKFILENLTFPEISGDYNPDSKLYIQFVVEKDGSITNVKVIRPVTNLPEFNTEVIRMMQTMPKWIPGKMNGKTVRSYFYLPIQICLE